MADALARANADQADLVVDVATLTGACMVALGMNAFGIFSDSEEVTGRVQDAPRRRESVAGRCRFRPRPPRNWSPRWPT